MSRDYHRQTIKRVNELSREAAQQFDSTLLHNSVSEHVDGGMDRHNMLIRTLDLAERAHDLSEDAESTGLHARAFEAAEELEAPVEMLVEKQVAKACGKILDEGDEWTDTWDESDVFEAKDEAGAWLRDHPRSAELAGVSVPEEVEA